MVQGPRRARKDYSVNVRHAGLTLRTIARVANAKKLAVVALVLAEEGRRRHARDYLAEDLAMLSLAYIVKEAGFCIVENPRFPRQEQLLANFSEMELYRMRID